MTEAIYLNVGGGRLKRQAFINIDLESGADVQCDVTRGLPYPNSSVDGIYTGDCIARLSLSGILSFLREARRVLRPGGRIRIATSARETVVQEQSENTPRQPEMRLHGHGWSKGDSESLRIAPPELGDRWPVDDENLSCLASFVGLEQAQRCAPNQSSDPFLAGIEDLAESTLIMECVRRADFVPDEPLVSIIVPVFRAEFLAACLDSALVQTHRNIEVLILDDSPSESVAEIAAAYVDRDSRVIYRRNDPPLGEAKNLSFGIKIARGEFVKPLYDDDLLEPDAIERLLAAWRTCPEARLAAGRRLPIAMNGKPLDPVALLGPALSASDAVLSGTLVVGQILSSGRNTLGEPTCMMFRRHDALNIAEPDVMSLFGRRCAMAGDVCLAMHLLSCGDLVYVSQPVARFRIHQGQRQRQDGAHEIGLATWHYLRTQGARLGFPVGKPHSQVEPGPPCDRFPTYVLESLATDDNFDEEGYLTANPDVADAVANRVFPSGWAHFDAHGRREGRSQRRITGLLPLQRRKRERIQPLFRADLPFSDTGGCADFASEKLKRRSILESLLNLPLPWRRTANMSAKHRGVRISDLSVNATLIYPYGGYAMALIEKYKDGLILEFGNGQRSSYHDNVVNFGVFIDDTTDVRGFAEDLPFRDNSFDAVFFLASRNHIQDQDKCLQEILRVLKPGGALLGLDLQVQPT